MAGGGGGGGGGGADQGGNAYYILWMLGLVIFVGVAIWYFFADQLKMAFLAIRQAELFLVALFVDYIPVQYIPGLEDLPARVDNDLDLARQITPETLTLDIADALSTEVGIFLRIPLGILMAFLAVMVYKSNILMRFTKTYNMRSLMDQEQVNWPQISVVNKINLIELDLDSGPWAMAMTPLQFAKKYKLITVELAPMVGSGFSKTVAPEFKMILDKTRAERAFMAQLGRPFQGLGAMAPHRRAIAAILIGRGCRDKELAQKLVYQLARSAGQGKLNLEGADEMWKKHEKKDLVQKILQKHAYELTIFASLLMFAREDGVVASADFLWVKPLDRRLWYVLNNVGRQTPASEVGGIFSHWYYECALKRPLSSPVVGLAVNALEVALESILYVPDDKEREEIIKRHNEAQAKPREEGDEAEHPTATTPPPNAEPKAGQ